MAPLPLRSTGSSSGAVPTTARPSCPTAIPNKPVCVMWDYENTRTSASLPGHVLVSSLRRLAHAHGRIVSFRAYIEVSSGQTMPQHVAVLRGELQGAGVSLVECPRGGREGLGSQTSAKDTRDKMLLVDALTFALDFPAPATVFLISGDRDLSYACATLRNRGYDVALLPPKVGAHPTLLSSASTVYSWEVDILGAAAAAATTSRPPPEQVQPKTEPTDDWLAPASSGAQSLLPSAPLPGPTRDAELRAWGSLSPQKAPSRTPLPAPTPPPPGGPSWTPRKAPSTPRATPTPTTASLSLLQNLSLSSPAERFAPLMSLLTPGRPALRSHVGGLLSKQFGRDVYARAGCDGFPAYVREAERAGVVRLGKGEKAGAEWIALREEGLWEDDA